MAIINSPSFEKRTYTRYELNYAIKKNKKIVVINPEQIKDQKGKKGKRTSKPAQCKKNHIPSRTYKPGKSRLKKLILGARKPAKRRTKTK